MSIWSKKVVWITGASSGIGRALAIELLEQGAFVIGTSRNSKALAEVSDSAHYLPLVADITDSENLENIAGIIHERFHKLDVLFANAGACEYVDMPDFDVEKIELIMCINYNGTVRTIKAALPLLRKADKPYLLCMSSSNAYVGLPRSQAYGPSKAAIYNLMQSLKADLKGQIDVSVICPGFVESKLTNMNDFAMPAKISAEKAAQYILKGMKKRKFDINFPKRFTYLLRFISVLPDSLLFRITTSLSRKSS